MKILYLTNLTVPYRMKFFNELSKKCDLTVIVERKLASNRNKEWLNSIKYQNFRLIELNAKEVGEESSFSFKIIKYLKEDYDCIVIGGYSTFTAMLAILYLKFKKKSFVLNADGGVVNYNERKINFLIKKLFISSASNWITTSKKAKEYLCYYGGMEKKIYIYPFSSVSENDIIDLTLLEKKKSKKKLSINENKKMILTVGQVINRKGLDILLNACVNANVDFELYIIGGNITDELKNIIDSNNMNNIHFIDFLDEHSLSEYYMAADLFIIPSRFDVWGLVVNEAIAYSLPVISSNSVGASLEIFDLNSEFLFESENIDELNSKINKIIGNDSVLKNMSLKSKEQAHKYTIEKMAESHMTIFKKIVNEENGHSST